MLLPILLKTNGMFPVSMFPLSSLKDFPDRVGRALGRGRLRPRKLAMCNASRLPQFGTTSRVKVSLSCSCAKQNLMVRPLSLIKEVLFRFAFGVCILIQIVLWFLLLGGISALFSSDRYFLQGVIVLLVFSGLFPIGAANYFLYHRIIREEYICAEAEKWLAERRAGDNPWIKRRKILKRWAVWIPTVTAILVCTFLDYTWAFASHLFYPGSGRLIGYEVSIPLTWTFQYGDLGTTANGAHSYVVASRFRGLWKAGSGLYIGRKPFFSASTMNFYSTPDRNPLATKPTTPILAERNISIGQGTIVCREEVPPRCITSARYINCSTPTGDFSGHFDGSDGDASEFYRIVESVKPTK